MKRLALLSLLASLSIAALTGACTYTQEEREITADRIARPAFMVERHLAAGPFVLYAWERMHERYQPATIYIEGDGPFEDPKYAAQVGVALNSPTPRNPVGLNLAAMDRSKNLGWLGRPCQYLPPERKSMCNAEYYGQKGRYAPEVLESYQAALDEMKKRYRLTEFTLVGYGGGAAIAAALAGTRSDVSCLKTVAGVLDTRAYSVAQSVPLAWNSINPVTFAEQLKRVPQVHYVGGYDTHVPASVYQSYRQIVDDGTDYDTIFVNDAGHDYAWVEQWPGLLTRSAECGTQPPAPEIQFVEPPAEFWDVRK